ncbi:MAG: DUF4347 domain-containing protein, partial [Alkalinema sp. RL_2_19]|nr:DUF4347 domain-containing protein [Alkalinema sp. RL_2_19]
MQFFSDSQLALAPTPSHQALVPNGDTQLVFIDTTLNAYHRLAAAVAGAEVVLLDSQRDGIAQISTVLADRTDIAAIHLVSHGTAGGLQLGSSNIDTANLSQYQAQIQDWQRSLTDNADILLYGCNVAASASGLNFVNQLSQLTGADIAASTDLTGHEALGGDWMLETATGTIEALIPFSAAIQDYSGVLPITVYAAGSTNEEQMQLQIDGTTVQTWNNIGGNAETRQFQAYTYNGADVDPGRIRVRFSNDRYEPANNIDRNLRIDRLVVGGNTYQAEAANVFSTGTWTPEDGVVPGFRRSEILHATGYFQFASVGGGNGDLIEIRARGDEGTEQFILEIGGNTVSSFVATPNFQTFTYQSNRTVSPNDIRINFVNDQFNPAQGIDSNLVVDFIKVAGTTYQTEAPTVFSTGTWKLEDGIVAGFRQSETLHANGYFQYAGSGTSSGVFEVDVTGVTVRENDATATVRVNRVNGSAGVATVDYVTNEDTAKRGSDFVNRTGTLTFAAGETSKNVAIAIVNDNVSEPTESFGFAILGATGAALGTKRTVSVTILDDDAANSTFAFSQPDYSLKEDGGQATITVSRSGSTTGAATVKYATSNGTARSGSDYTAASGTLSFAAGQTSKTFTVSITNDTEGERNETVNLALSAPTGGVLGTQKNAVLNILDNDPGSFTRDVLITGLTTPTAIDWTPNGQYMFIAEQNGLVKVANAATNDLQSVPFIDLRSQVNGVRDRGLLGMTLDPQFNSGRPYVYLLYTYD